MLLSFQKCIIPETMAMELKDRLRGSRDFASRREKASGPRTDWYRPKLHGLIVKGKHIGWASRTPNTPGFEVIGFVCRDLDWYTFGQDQIKALGEYREHNELADHDFGSVPGMLYLLREQVGK